MKITSCRLHVSAARPEDFPRDGRPQVAFMGRSNVGKSSLLNRLLGVRGLARTSKEPGRTRAVHFYAVNERLYFVDLPGYGYARVPEEMRRGWRGLMRAYFAPGRPDLAVHLVDARHEPTDLDRELLEGLREARVRHEVVLTKIDKLSGAERARSLARAARWLGLPPGRLPLAVSATKGDGLPALWRVIDGACAGGAANMRPEAPPAGGVSDETSRATRSDTLRARAANQGGRTIL